MNFMQGTAIPLDQRSLDAFEIGSHHDPPLLLLHAPANGFYSYRVMLFYHCVCVFVFVRARLVFLRPAAIYRFFLFPLLLSVFIEQQLLKFTRKVAPFLI